MSSVKLSVMVLCCIKQQSYFAGFGYCYWRDQQTWRVGGGDVNKVIEHVEVHFEHCDSGE
jgi:hypothetical protein